MNDLVEALAVAILIVIALLTLSLGWRAAFVVAVAIPVVFVQETRKDDRSELPNAIAGSLGIGLAR